MADTLLRRRLDEAADVVLKGVQPQAGVSGDEGLFGDRVAGLDLAGEPPGQCVEDVGQVRKVGLFVQRCIKLERGDVKQVRGCGDAGGTYGIVHAIGAKDDVAGVKRLRQAEGAGPRGVEVGGQAEVVERVEAVGAVDGQQAGREEAAVEDFRGRGADPVDIGRRGLIVKREDQNEIVMGSALR